MDQENAVSKIASNIEDLIDEVKDRKEISYPLLGGAAGYMIGKNKGNELEQKAWDMSDQQFISYSVLEIIIEHLLLERGIRPQAKKGSW